MTSLYKPVNFLESFLVKEMEKAEEENKQIELFTNEINVERAALEKRLQTLNDNVQEMMKRRANLKERIHNLRVEFENYRPEIGYFMADDGYYYVDTFELEWINDHTSDHSGPLQCSNCETFGTVIQDEHLVFLGYCLNCAEHIYHFKRGQGFQGFDNIEDVRKIENGVEHLNKYRLQILSYINNRLNARNFQLQFPEDTQQHVETVSSSVQDNLVPPPPPTTAPVNHFDTTDCNCDSEDDVHVQETQDDNCVEDSSDDYAYLCDCCHPPVPNQQV